MQDPHKAKLLQPSQNLRRIQWLVDICLAWTHTSTLRDKHKIDF